MNKDVMLVSIKQDFVQWIKDGTKKFEFRTWRPKDAPKWLVIYCSKPDYKGDSKIQTGKVVAVARTREPLGGEGLNAFVWKKTHKAMGGDPVTKTDFCDWYEGRVAYAYPLLHVRFLRKPIALGRIRRGLGAPQKCVFLTSEEFRRI